MTDAAGGPPPGGVRGDVIPPPSAGVTAAAGTSEGTTSRSTAPEAWSLQRDERVQRYDVAFPMLTVAARNLTLPAYVEVRWTDRRECLRTDRKTRAKGRDKLGVSSSAFGGGALPSDATATWVPATAWCWHRGRLEHDRSLLLATVGLLLATVGVVIDGSLALGKVKVLVPLSDDWILALTALKFALQGVGLFLAFWKGVLDSSK